jgi:hypothetical protein
MRADAMKIIGDVCGVQAVVLVAAISSVAEAFG